MLSSYTVSPPAAPPAVSTHFVGESTRAVCFLKDATHGDHGDPSDTASLPLIAVGGDQTLALYLPEVISSDEAALRHELANGNSSNSTTTNTNTVQLRPVAETAHDGDVTALRFASDHANLLLAASSTGSIHALRVGGDRDSLLTPLTTTQWLNLFGDHASATAMDVWSDRATLVTVSSSGAVAWLRFDDLAAAPQVVRNGDSSRLPIYDVKILARETVAATVGAAPGAQLRVWDSNANTDCPVAVASDPHATCVLTAIETHPTRPELLITGSDDGRVALWDLRRLGAPLRVEAKHQRAVRTLTIHRTSPRLLFSGGDDATVLAWDFHHNRTASETVEYEKHHHHQNGGGLHVQPLGSGFLPWRTMDFHASSDTLVAGSDAQSLLLVRHASRAHRALA